ncbi:MAG TPA: hypothetical protein VHD60_02630 [Candidatus Saccharimonadales bacterium]|nr:hypothetical protein [Candidatus Saccharimonadales bacterium]
MNYLALLVFSIVWLGIVYGINRLLAGKPLKTNKFKATLYIVTMAALGLLGEVCFDVAYNAGFGHPLWRYQLFPIHHAYTSVYSLYLWGSVGLYIYWLHDTLRKKRLSSILIRSVIFSLDAILFELGVNGSYKLIFHHYLFYYLPSDLWHLTSVQTLPLYLLAGFITVEVMEQEKTHPRFAMAGSIALALCLVGGGILTNR